MPDFLLLSDLENQITTTRIVQYLDDDGDGVVVDGDSQVIQVLDQAEQQYYSRLLRAYSTRQTLIDLANGDPAVKGHVIWIACELAAERRPELTNEDGWGAFRVQYERAISELNLLSKGNARSIAEETIGRGANTGGRIQPAPPSGTAQQFVFSSNNNNTRGPGGF